MTSEDQPKAVFDPPPPVSAKSGRTTAEILDELRTGEHEKVYGRTICSSTEELGMMGDMTSADESKWVPAKTPLEELNALYEQQQRKRRNGSPGDGDPPQKELRYRPKKGPER